MTSRAHNSTAYRPTGRGTRIYRQESVFDAALARIDRIFSEFGPNVVVRVSGGKDSTVVFNLALRVATERHALPLKVWFLDQEAEWQATVDIMRDRMHRDDVEPYWLQVPFRLSNSVSQELWLHCWDESERAKWIHPRDPIALTENIYGTDRFHDLFPHALRSMFGNRPAAALTGVRAEESPARRMGLTGSLTYKDITWGRRENARIGHYAFHPLYDWSYTDVWKAIFDNDWRYNRIYDAQFQYGIPFNRMRVSALHHETSVMSLFYLQEFEPETYARVVARVPGVDAAAKMGFEDYFVHDLPSMFTDWRDYRDYLAAHLLADDARKKMRHIFAHHDAVVPSSLTDKMLRVHVQAILVQDHEGVKLANWLNGAAVQRAILDHREGR